MKRVHTGIDRLISQPPDWIKDQRIGLLCNPASIDAHYRHSRLLIDSIFPGQIKALFSPQHGFFSEKQDNMIESDHMVDPVLNVPVFSLYGETRCPDTRMFDLIDVLISDLQDVGTRVYTFTSTLSYCMEAAQKYGKSVLVLDRPNPLGGIQVEGNCLVPSYNSFVGRYPIPMRHGLTMAEYAGMINEHFDIGCELHICRMQGWKRSMLFKDTGLPWVAPSPNLPTPISTLVYPGQVIWEGTNISEGRGTTQPFEIFGAPYLKPQDVLHHMKLKDPKGYLLREIAFEPTSNKWKGERCQGFHLHVLDSDDYQPYETSLLLLQTIIECHVDGFKWKEPPYEYEFDKLPIDLIIGDRHIREQLEKGQDLEEIKNGWRSKLKDFINVSKQYYLYDQKDE